MIDRAYAPAYFPIKSGETRNRDRDKGRAQDTDEAKRKKKQEYIDGLVASKGERGAEHASRLLWLLTHECTRENKKRTEMTRFTFFVSSSRP